MLHSAQWRWRRFLNLTNDTLLVMPVTVVAAILLLRTGQNTKIHGDAAIAMLSVGALAVGYLLLNLFSTSTNINGDVCGTLFGSTSILTLTTAEVWLCVAASVVVIFIYVFFYNKIFAVTFDENFATATGMKADRYNLLIAVVTDSHYRACNEPCRFPADFGTGDIPGAVCHAGD